MKCEELIQKIVSFDEVRLINRLFDKIGIDKPTFSKLAELKTDHQTKNFNCPHLISWGFKYYCCNAEVIQAYQKKNKNT